MSIFHFLFNEYATKISNLHNLVPRCVASEIMQIYPLHYYDDLKPLKKKWYSSFSNWMQPIGKLIVFLIDSYWFTKVEFSK